jgi:hypothetical protein
MSLKIQKTPKRTKFPGHSHLGIPGKSRNHLPSLNAEKGRRIALNT